MKMYKNRDINTKDNTVSQEQAKNYKLEESIFNMRPSRIGTTQIWGEDIETQTKMQNDFSELLTENDA